MKDTVQPFWQDNQLLLQFVCYHIIIVIPINTLFFIVWNLNN